MHTTVQSAYFGGNLDFVIHQGIAYLSEKESQALASLSTNTRKTSATVAAHLDKEITFYDLYLCDDLLQQHGIHYWPLDFHRDWAW
jgi:hypothetical protein